MNNSFIGRVTELDILHQLKAQKKSSLVIMQGRRRIGKSRLIQEFARDKRLYTFAGMAPTLETDAQAQRDEFSRQMGEQMGLPGLIARDWGDLFTLLAKQTTNEDCVILFDEISWMGDKDANFLGKLKNAWDIQFSQNAGLMLVLCGSVSSWIEKNIISNTAFLGRPSLYLHLEELPLKECNRFWGEHRNRISAFEKLKLLSVTGGVPRYLELMEPHLNAEENIKRLCFRRSSPLLNEFERIFSDIFGTRSDIYKKIINILVQGPATQSDILAYCKRSKTGDFSDYLKDLVMAGFIARDLTWDIKTTKPSKLSHYRLKDNYTRFYLKYIAPNKTRIEKDGFKNISVGFLKGWETMLGLQFENLVLNNQSRIFEGLNIAPEEVLFANPFFQRPTKINAGCQIDFMIQTRFDCLYICEIKFSKSTVGASVIGDVRQKIKCLNYPHRFSYRPVLIHVNGIQKSIQESGFFSSVIDFGQLLK